MSRLSNVSIKSYIRESMDGDPIDLLSSNAKQNVFSKIPNKSKQSNNGSAEKSSDVSNNNLPYSEDGRLNIGRLFDQLEGKRGQKRSADDSNIDGDEDDDDSDDDSDNKTQFTSKSYKPGGRGIHRPVASSSTGQKPGNDNRSMVSSKRSSKKSAKSKKSSILHGDVYRSKKAAGDMKRRGLPDPYAYYPLNAMSLNRRKHLKQRGELKAIVKSARQGAAKGRHIRNKRHKTQK